MTSLWGHGVSLVRATGNPTDHRIGLLQVDSVSSTQVGARFVVTTASATVGATCKLLVKIRAKNS